MSSIAENILQATHDLRKSGVSEARREAGSLMAHVLKRDRSFILAHADDPLSGDDIKLFREYLADRMKGKPLQYITGNQEFYGLDFEVTADVLIPRPETELLVEKALQLMGGLQQSPFICEVGTGSGCIVISLLHELRKFPETRAVAVDISEAALEVAKRNAARHGVDQRIEFAVSDCFVELGPGRHSFDLIVSNPPYLRTAEIGTLQREVRDFEPRLALEAGTDGLTIVKRLLNEAGRFLKNDGYLLFEIGFDQSEETAQLIDQGSWKLLDIYKDLQGIPRTVALQRRR